MLSRWVPFLRPRARPRETRFKRSLVRNFLTILLLVSLIPILLIGTLNYFRTSEMLRTQASRQIESTVHNNTAQISEYVDRRNNILKRLILYKTFTDNISSILHAAPASTEYFQAKVFLDETLQDNLKSPDEDFFDQMFFIRPDGTVIVQTDERWVNENLGGKKVDDPLFRGLVGTNKSLLVYSPVAGYTNKLVLVTSRSFTDEKGALLATLVTTSSSDVFYRTLSSSNSLLLGASTYYFTQDAGLIGTTLNGQLDRAKDEPKLTDKLAPMTGDQRTQSLFQSTINQKTPVYAFAEWIPEYNLGIVMTVPEATVFEQNKIADPINILLLLVSVLLSGILVYFSINQLARPIVQLTQAADDFSKGTWTVRTRINRTDELGLLSFSFNRMADELSELYHSMENVVEKRTGQLRIASEVAQLATSTSKLSEVLGRVVELIAERFGFYHVAIYLFDETGQNLVLQEASGTAGEQIKSRGDRVEANDNTIVGWVATKNQAKIIAKTDPLFRPEDLLPDTLSETAIPITTSAEVWGVLDIQSTLTDAFDEETVAVFQTLANQISGTLQATRVLEATQVSYQETALLYRATRQVIQAHNEEEIIQNLTDTFIQLPFVGSIISMEGENFKILVVTDPKTGRVEKGLQSLNIPTGQMAALLSENRVVLIEDIAQRNDYENMLSFLLRRGCKSAALISVIENGHLSKVLILGTREANQITHTSLQPYANLAEVIGASLEKYRMVNTLQKRLSELQILANFSQAISAETELDRLYHVLHEQVMETMGPDLEFAVAIYNQRDETIEWPYFYEEKQVATYPPAKLGEGLTSIVIQNRQPLLLNTERAARERGAIISGRPSKSWMGIPLIFAGNVVGAMLIQDLDNENVFSEDDLNLFMTLAPQIATNIRNAQLYTETQQALRAYDQERFLFNTLLDSIPEGISIKDTHGRYIRASNSIAQIFNINAEEIVGKTDYDLLGRDAAEKIFRDEQMVMNIGQPEFGLIQYQVNESGKETWMHTSRLPIRTPSGNPYGLLLIQRDITELKQAEALAQRRAEQVLTAAEIARDTTGTLDVELLLQKSVNLVRDRFGFYHASIFLIDAAGDNAVLRESTGEAGQKMMQAGHHLAVGSKSIVGQVTATGKALIVNDVTVDPTHLPNPLLPDTRSELAIPLKVGERVLGALDVQSTQGNAFHDEDVGILQILADQMAVAVVNGELFAKTQDLLGKHRLLREVSIAASISTNLEDALMNVVSGLRSAKVGDRIAILMLNEEKVLEVHASSGYERIELDKMQVAPGAGICGRAIAEKRAIRVDDTTSEPGYISVDPNVRSELAIPILFSDEILGILNLESSKARAFDENDQEILGALGNNLGGVIANIRLVNRVRQQVIRERQLYDVTSKIRYSVDIETILETSTKEIARALGARRASIRITAGNTQGPETLPGDGLSPNGGNGNGRKKEQ